ncbi:MAG: alpha/beta hydrolase-fold protein [candidate division KSB1 bacterium]|nr:alpha/beta hydrolase-fold protein [candidate division KSB1 bacterium]
MSARIWAPSAVLAFCCLSLNAANGQVFPEWHSRLLKRVYTSRDGMGLPYRLWIPSAYDSLSKCPLILFLHGAGERGSDNEAQLKNDEFLSLIVDPGHPAILVAPQCPADMWWSKIEFDRNRPQGFSEEPTVPMRLTIELLDTLEKEFRIDPERRYVTGLSMGGYGTFDLLVRRPGYFAAAVPICGGGDSSRARLIADVAIWVFHGAQDPLVPVERSRAMVAALRRVGASVRYTEYPDVGHDAWKRAYLEPELRSWLFQQKRSSRGPGG